MSEFVLSDADLEKLARFATVLIPGTGAMPSAGSLEGYATLLRTAVKATHYTADELRAVLAAIPSGTDLASAKAFEASDPANFEKASIIVSGAYFISPAILGKLGYPTERQHPAGDSEFADEYETGIVDVVTARGPVWRDPGKTSD